MISKNYCCVATALFICIQLFTSVEAVPIVRDGEQQKEIFCHYEPFATYSSPNIEELITDGNRCNHIVLHERIKSEGETELKKSNGTDGFYSHIPAFQEKGIRVSIGIQTGSRFDEGVHFVQLLTDFIKKHRLDGLTIFYFEEESAHTLLEFIRQVSEAFQPHGFLLTTLVANNILVNRYFNVKTLSSYVNWMIPFGYEKVIRETKHLAPIYFYEGDAHRESTLSWTVNYLKENGVPSEKIALNVLTFGHALLISSTEKVLGVPAQSIAFSIPSFPAICTMIKEGNLTVVHDKRVGTYAYSYQDHFFTSYYDIGDAYSLGKYVLKENLGGGSIFLFNYDDVGNHCGCGQMPLLNGLVQGLRNITVGKAENCT